MAVVVAAACLVAGCSGISQQSVTMLADPGRYDLYSCEQLAQERKAVASRTTELRTLMSHAQDDGAGPLLAELGYGSDYAATRGQLQVAENAWRAKGCDVSLNSPNSPSLNPVAVRPPGAIPASNRAR
jgi:hypothetical protein